MTVSGKKEGDVFVFKIEGRLDSSNSLTAEEQFSKWIDDGERKFVGDLSDLEFLSSAGLRVLLQVLKKVTPDGGKVVVFNLGSIVNEILRISGLDSTFFIAKDKAEALSNFSG